MFKYEMTSKFFASEMFLFEVGFFRFCCFNPNRDYVNQWRLFIGNASFVSFFQCLFSNWFSPS